MTNIYYKSTYRTTMTNNINIMQWICTGNYSMTSDESVAHINIKSPKDWITTLLLCIFLGTIGVHRFYVGKIGSGVAQIFTLGGCGIWTFVDLIMILTGSFTDESGKKIISK